MPPRTMFSRKLRISKTPEFSELVVVVKPSTWATFSHSASGLVLSKGREVLAMLQSQTLLDWLF